MADFGAGFMEVSLDPQVLALLREQSKSYRILEQQLMKIFGTSNLRDAERVRDSLLQGIAKGLPATGKRDTNQVLTAAIRANVDALSRVIRLAKKEMGDAVGLSFDKSGAMSGNLKRAQEGLGAYTSSPSGLEAFQFYGQQASAEGFTGASGEPVILQMEATLEKTAKKAEKTKADAEKVVQKAKRVKTQKQAAEKAVKEAQAVVAEVSDTPDIASLMKTLSPDVMNQAQAILAKGGSAQDLIPLIQGALGTPTPQNAPAPRIRDIVSKMEPVRFTGFRQSLSANKPASASAQGVDVGELSDVVVQAITEQVEAIQRLMSGKDVTGSAIPSDKLHEELNRARSVAAQAIETRIAGPLARTARFVDQGSGGSGTGARGQALVSEVEKLVNQFLQGRLTTSEGGIFDQAALMKGAKSIRDYAIDSRRFANAELTGTPVRRKAVQTYTAPIHDPKEYNDRLDATFSSGLGVSLSLLGPQDVSRYEKPFESMSPKDVQALLYRDRERTPENIPLSPLHISRAYKEVDRISALAGKGLASKEQAELYGDLQAELNVYERSLSGTKGAVRPRELAEEASNRMLSTLRNTRQSASSDEKDDDRDDIRAYMDEMKKAGEAIAKEAYRRGLQSDKDGDEYGEADNVSTQNRVARGKESRLTNQPELVQGVVQALRSNIASYTLEPKRVVDVDQFGGQNVSNLDELTVYARANTEVQKLLQGVRESSKSLPEFVSSAVETLASKRKGIAPGDVIPQAFEFAQGRGITNLDDVIRGLEVGLQKVEARQAQTKVTDQQLGILRASLPFARQSASYGPEGFALTINRRTTTPSNAAMVGSNAYPGSREDVEFPTKPLDDANNRNAGTMGALASFFIPMTGKRDPNVPFSTYFQTGAGRSSRREAAASDAVEMSHMLADIFSLREQAGGDTSKLAPEQLERLQRYRATLPGSLEQVLEQGGRRGERGFDSARSMVLALTNPSPEDIPDSLALQKLARGSINKPVLANTDERLFNPFANQLQVIQSAETKGGKPQVLSLAFENEKGKRRQLSQLTATDKSTAHVTDIESLNELLASKEARSGRIVFGDASGKDVGVELSTSKVRSYEDLIKAISDSKLRLQPRAISGATGATDTLRDYLKELVEVDPTKEGISRFRQRATDVFGAAPGLLPSGDVEEFRKQQNAIRFQMVQQKSDLLKDVPKGDFEVFAGIQPDKLLSSLLGYTGQPQGLPRFAIDQLTDVRALQRRGRTSEFTPTQKLISPLAEKFFTNRNALESSLLDSEGNRTEHTLTAGRYEEEFRALSTMIERQARPQATVLDRKTNLADIGKNLYGNLIGRSDVRNQGDDAEQAKDSLFDESAAQARLMEAIRASMVSGQLDRARSFISTTPTPATPTRAQLTAQQIIDSSTSNSAEEEARRRAQEAKLNRPFEGPNASRVTQATDFSNTGGGLGSGSIVIEADTRKIIEDIKRDLTDESFVLRNFAIDRAAKEKGIDEPIRQNIQALQNELSFVLKNFRIEGGGKSQTDQLKQMAELFASVRESAGGDFGFLDTAKIADAVTRWRELRDAIGGRSGANQRLLNFIQNTERLQTTKVVELANAWKIVREELAAARQEMEAVNQASAGRIRTNRRYETSPSGERVLASSTTTATLQARRVPFDVSEFTAQLTKSLQEAMAKAQGGGQADPRLYSGSVSSEQLLRYAQQVIAYRSGSTSIAPQSGPFPIGAPYGTGRAKYVDDDDIADRSQELINLRNIPQPSPDVLARISTIENFLKQSFQHRQRDFVTPRGGDNLPYDSILPNPGLFEQQSRFATDTESQRIIQEALTRIPKDASLKKPFSLDTILQRSIDDLEFVDPKTDEWRRGGVQLTYGQQRDAKAYVDQLIRQRLQQTYQQERTRLEDQGYDPERAEVVARHRTPAEASYIHNIRNPMTGGYYSQQLNIVSRDAGNIEQPLHKQVEITEKFNKEIDTAYKRVTLYASAAYAVYGLVNAFQQGLDVITSTDYSLARMSYLMNSVRGDMDELRKGAFALAKDFGFGIQETLAAMTTFAQQGRSMNETLDLTRASLLAANQADISAAQATEALTAAMAIFNFSASESVDIIDSWSAVANKNAVTAGVLADAIKKVGAAANLVGVDFHEMNAIITTLNQVTRKSGQEIGTSLRFIFQRAGTSETVQMLESLGVAVMNSEGAYRPLLDILGDVRGQLDQMTESQRRQVLVQLAGIRHYSDLNVLLRNFDQIQRVTRQSTDAFGTSQENNEAIMATLAKQVQITKTSFQELAVEVGAGGAVGAFKTTASVVTFLVDVVKTLPDGFKGVATASAFIITAVAAIGRVFAVLSGDHIPGAIEALRLYNAAQRETNQLKQQSAAQVQQYIRALNLEQATLDQVSRRQNILVGSSAYQRLPQAINQRIYNDPQLRAAAQGSADTGAIVGQFRSAQPPSSFLKTGAASFGLLATSIGLGEYARKRLDEDKGTFRALSDTTLSTVGAGAAAGASVGLLFGGAPTAVGGATIGATAASIGLLRNYKSELETNQEIARKTLLVFEEQVEAVRELQSELRALQNSQVDPTSGVLEVSRRGANEPLAVREAALRTFAQLAQVRNPRSSETYDAIFPTNGRDALGFQTTALTGSLDSVVTSQEALSQFIDRLNSTMQDVRLELARQTAALARQRGEQNVAATESLDSDNRAFQIRGGAFNAPVLGQFFNYLRDLEGNLTRFFGRLAEEVAGESRFSNSVIGRGTALNRAAELTRQFPGSGDERLESLLKDLGRVQSARQEGRANVQSLRGTLSSEAGAAFNFSVVREYVDAQVRNAVVVGLRGTNKDVDSILNNRESEIDPARRSTLLRAAVDAQRQIINEGFKSSGLQLFGGDLQANYRVAQQRDLGRPFESFIKQSGQFDSTIINELRAGDTFFQREPDGTLTQSIISEFDDMGNVIVQSLRETANGVTKVLEPVRYSKDEFVKAISDMNASLVNFARTSGSGEYFQSFITNSADINEMTKSVGRVLEVFNRQFRLIQRDLEISQLSAQVSRDPQMEARALYDSIAQRSAIINRRGIEVSPLELAPVPEQVLERLRPLAEKAGIDLNAVRSGSTTLETVRLDDRDIKSREENTDALENVTRVLRDLNRLTIEELTSQQGRRAELAIENVQGQIDRGASPEELTRTFSTLIANRRIFADISQEDIRTRVQNDPQGLLNDLSQQLKKLDVTEIARQQLLPSNFKGASNAISTALQDDRLGVSELMEFLRRLEAGLRIGIQTERAYSEGRLTNAERVQLQNENLGNITTPSGEEAFSAESLSSLNVEDLKTNLDRVRQTIVNVSEFLERSLQTQLQATFQQLDKGVLALASTLDRAQIDRRLREMGRAAVEAVQIFQGEGRFEEAAAVLLKLGQAAAFAQDKFGRRVNVREQIAPYFEQLYQRPEFAGFQGITADQALGAAQASAENQKLAESYAQIANNLETLERSFGVFNDIDPTIEVVRQLRSELEKLLQVFDPSDEKVAKLVNQYQELENQLAKLERYFAPRRESFLRFAAEDLISQGAPLIGVTDEVKSTISGNNKLRRRAAQSGAIPGIDLTQLRELSRQAGEEYDLLVGADEAYRKTIEKGFGGRVDEPVSVPVLFDFASELDRMRATLEAGFKVPISFNPAVGADNYLANPTQPPVAGRPIPGFAQGIARVPRDGFLAHLHHGEAVIPAHLVSSLPREIVNQLPGSSAASGDTPRLASGFVPRTSLPIETVDARNVLYAAPRGYNNSVPTAKQQLELLDALTHVLDQIGEYDGNSEDFARSVRAELIRTHNYPTTSFPMSSQPSNASVLNWLQHLGKNEVFANPNDAIFEFRDNDKRIVALNDPEMAEHLRSNLEIELGRSFNQTFFQSQALGEFGSGLNATARNKAIAAELANLRNTLNVEFREAVEARIRQAKPGYTADQVRMEADRVLPDSLSFNRDTGRVSIGLKLNDIKTPLGPEGPHSVDFSRVFDDVQHEFVHRATALTPADVKAGKVDLDPLTIALERGLQNKPEFIAFGERVINAGNYTQNEADSHRQTLSDGKFERLPDEVRQRISAEFLAEAFAGRRDPAGKLGNYALDETLIQDRGVREALTEAARNRHLGANLLTGALLDATASGNQDRVTDILRMFYGEDRASNDKGRQAADASARANTSATVKQVETTLNSIGLEAGADARRTTRPERISPVEEVRNAALEFEDSFNPTQIELRNVATNATPRSGWRWLYRTGAAVGLGLGALHVTAGLGFGLPVAALATLAGGAYFLRNRRNQARILGAAQSTLPYLRRAGEVAAWSPVDAIRNRNARRQAERERISAELMTAEQARSAETARRLGYQVDVDGNINFGADGFDSLPTGLPEPHLGVPGSYDPAYLVKQPIPADLPAGDLRRLAFDAQRAGVDVFGDPTVHPSVRDAALPYKAELDAMKQRALDLTEIRQLGETAGTSERGIRSSLIDAREAQEKIWLEQFRRVAVDGKTEAGRQNVLEFLRRNVETDPSFVRSALKRLFSNPGSTELDNFARSLGVDSATTGGAAKYKYLSDVVRDVRQSSGSLADALPPRTLAEADERLRTSYEMDNAAIRAANDPRAQSYDLVREELRAEAANRREPGRIRAGLNEAGASRLGSSLLRAYDYAGLPLGLVGGFAARDAFFSDDAEYTAGLIARERESGTFGLARKLGFGEKGSAIASSLSGEATIAGGFAAAFYGANAAFGPRAGRYLGAAGLGFGIYGTAAGINDTANYVSKGYGTKRDIYGRLATDVGFNAGLVGIDAAFLLGSGTTAATSSVGFAGTSGVLGAASFTLPVAIAAAAGYAAIKGVETNYIAGSNLKLVQTQEAERNRAALRNDRYRAEIAKRLTGREGNAQENRAVTDEVMRFFLTQDPQYQELRKSSPSAAERYYRQIRSSIESDAFVAEDVLRSISRDGLLDPVTALASQNRVSGIEAIRAQNQNFNPTDETRFRLYQGELARSGQTAAEYQTAKTAFDAQRQAVRDAETRRVAEDPTKGRSRDQVLKDAVRRMIGTNRYDEIVNSIRSEDSRQIQDQLVASFDGAGETGIIDLLARGQRNPLDTPRAQQELERMVKDIESGIAGAASDKLLAERFASFFQLVEGSSVDTAKIPGYDYYFRNAGQQQLIDGARRQQGLPELPRELEARRRAEQQAIITPEQIQATADPYSRANLIEQRSRQQDQLARQQSTRASGTAAGQRTALTSYYSPERVEELRNLARTITDPRLADFSYSRFLPDGTTREDYILGIPNASFRNAIPENNTQPLERTRNGRKEYDVRQYLTPQEFAALPVGTPAYVAEDVVSRIHSARMMPWNDGKSTMDINGIKVQKFDPLLQKYVNTAYETDEYRAWVDRGYDPEKFRKPGGDPGYGKFQEEIMTARQQLATATTEVTDLRTRVAKNLYNQKPYLEAKELAAQTDRVINAALVKKPEDRSASEQTFVDDLLLAQGRADEARKREREGLQKYIDAGAPQYFRAFTPQKYLQEDDMYYNRNKGYYNPQYFHTGGYNEGGGTVQLAPGEMILSRDTVAESLTGLLGSAFNRSAETLLSGVQLPTGAVTNQTIQQESRSETHVQVPLNVNVFTDRLNGGNARDKVKEMLDGVDLLQNLGDAPVRIY